MTAILFRSNKKVLSLILLFQAFCLDSVFAGPKLSVQAEIVKTEQSLAKAISDEERNSLTAYLEVLRRIDLSESDSDSSEGIQKYPGLISVKLRNRIRKSTGFFRNNPDHIFKFFDQVEKSKKDWKQKAAVEKPGADMPESHPVLGGELNVVAVNGDYLCVDLGVELGKGAASVVDLALLYDTWDPVALVLGQKLSSPSEESTRKLVQREAKKQRVIDELDKAYKAGDDPVGLPKVFAVGARKLAMKRYLGTVFDLLDSGRMTADQKKKFFIQTTRGMVWLHSKGIVHKDIKLENMLYDQDEAVYADYDLAEFPGDEIRKENRTYSGSPGYAAPEILKGLDWVGGDFSNQLKTAFKADVFSHSITWAIVFYLLGRSEVSFALNDYISGPMGNSDVLSKLISALQNQKGDPIAALLAKGLVEDPRMRISSQEFLDEVQEIYSPTKIRSLFNSLLNLGQGKLLTRRVK